MVDLLWFVLTLILLAEEAHQRIGGWMRTASLRQWKR